MDGQGCAPQAVCRRWIRGIYLLWARVLCLTAKPGLSACTLNLLPPSCCRETIRTRIIPHAVRWYTGEANEDEDDEDDEDDDEDDFDEDDDVRATSACSSLHERA